MTLVLRARASILTQTRLDLLAEVRRQPRNTDDFAQQIAQDGVAPAEPILRAS